MPKHYKLTLRPEEASSLQELVTQRRTSIVLVRAQCRLAVAAHGLG